MSALIAENVSVRLGKPKVLSGISLRLRTGALTVVVGPNGAGKSTLLRTLAGLVVPAEGRVALDGTALHRMRPSERARAIAYLPQGGAIAWPLPVEEVVALGRMPYGEGPGRLRPEGRQAVADAVVQVGLSGFERRPASELSGGERARVLLARALAVGAPVLLADEPVAALDPRHQLVVLEVLKARAARGGTAVAVMHDLGLAARFADEIVLLESGRLRACGPPAEVLTPAALAESFGVAARVETSGGRLVIVAEAPIGGRGGAAGTGTGDEGGESA
jgi:iron complex transport system ATP-binding protein